MSLDRVLIATTLMLTAGAALADVTINTHTDGKASILDVTGDGVTMIKGARQRSDNLFKGKTQTLIIDIDGRRFVDLDAKKKTATVMTLDSIAEQLQKVGTGAIDAKLTKTSATKTVAGHSCTVHDINLSLPFSPTGNPGDGMDLTMQLTGTVCLAANVPGLADYQAFYRAAADSGFIFGDPRVAKSPTGAAQAKAYAALTRKMADAGMALESHVVIDAAGGGPMAGMMGRLAKSDITTTVTKIETGALPAESFDVPADYKVKNK
jgi:hypothetical protein